MLRESVEAVRHGGIALDTWGEHCTFTLPKAFSVRIDALLWEDTEQYKAITNKLRQGAWRCYKRSLHRACEEAGMPLPGELGAMAVLHHWGRSAPWEAHYHWHFFVAPYTADYQGEGGMAVKARPLAAWRSVLRWWPEKSLEDMRKDWKRTAQRILKAKYPGDFNVYRSYLKNANDVGKTMAYQLRAPMQDLWLGIRGNDDIGYRYERKAVRHRGKDKMPAINVPVALEQFDDAQRRADLVGRNEVAQRVTWYGLLVNYRQANTLKQLGMIRIDLDDDPDKPEGRANDHYWRPVSADDTGVLFENTNGNGVVELVAWSDMRPDPVPGPCGKPIGKTRRRVWLAMGKIRAGPTTKQQEVQHGNNEK